VINPTEALIAIDVNSGKATKEHNIEETALQTNIEAAVEIARQLRLRDIAGLIVIDFIDMEYMGNVRTIERRFRDSLKGDRARIFTNRISALGLLEMSRQRLRASLYEISTEPCPHCEASGRTPSMSTLSLRLMRQVEDLGVEGRFPHVLVQAPQELSLFLLNAKRKLLDDIEKRYEIKITVTPNPRFRMPHFNIQGLTEDRMAAELAKDETLASYVLGDEASGSEPVGFGKSDGKGSFPGKKRRRGNRGGNRNRPARQQDNRNNNQQSKAPTGDAGKPAKPEGGNKNQAQGNKVIAKPQKSGNQIPVEKVADVDGNVMPKKQDVKADKPKTSRGRKPAPKKEAAPAKPVAIKKPVEKKEPVKKAPAKAKAAEKAPVKAKTEKPAADVKKEKAGPKKRGWWSKK
jgi:ribonuclease E